MVYISPQIQILTTVRKGAVYYFEEETFESKNGHYFVVLNQSPHNDVALILVCASSQVKKRKLAAQILGFAPETQVIVTPAECGLFSVETIFDCNSVLEKSIQTLVDKMTNGKLRLCGEIMPDTIVDKLIEGVMASRLVAKHSKNILRSF